jgi:GT2 family glycosyltransferase
MSDIALSICIVTFQAGDYLRDCLSSIYTNPPNAPFETIVVDNHSTDGTLDMLRNQFPKVLPIENPENRGYSVPMNQALRKGRGRYLLQLNPDTLIPPSMLDRLIMFMDPHPEVGICGPKVVNPDGTMQKPCRRGESRPWAVITYFTGLSRLFPKNKCFSEYLMSYMDENAIHEVAGVSGSCMMIRREVIDQIGMLDERFFAYQEDADYCFRARQAGWKIFYVPSAQIIHYGGVGGSHVQPVRSIFEWHRAYWFYYRKNLAVDYPFLFNWFYYLAMGVKLFTALVLYYLRRGRFANKWNPS